MKWEEFKHLNILQQYERYLITDIECPVCHSKIYQDVGLVYTSLPPKYEYRCFACGWHEIA